MTAWLDAFSPLVLLALTLGLPHVPAFVRCFRPLRPAGGLLRASFIVFPPIVYVLFARHFFVLAAADIRSHDGRACGGFGAIALLVVFGGALLQLVIGIVIQAAHLQALRTIRHGGAPPESPASA